ncbi:MULTISPECIES: ABC transporter permease [Paraburkholderia]|uniref:Aliphatic sulfonates transport permease protein SsuC n=1 Tax=Paraburkholderia nemoris TaxID=2793076 RepID=A0ABN7NBJ1_9BURK|nr:MULTISPECIES: ABC transporter permease [Paraburkholderia]KPD15109.1 ABC transporter permease [Burkholderia sp. ST111]MBK5185747.1 ABC transporter permease [Burkholderia sp. R-69749]MBK3744582.1 ABC transporter permease [Paraburkholderia aspalathi]MBK3816532.1 ABC transporter permease [Paraburkholderia aspalathi]CAE6844521.1 Putative aliphatic sulfonates transport permease protein SsuC [Paraburkholderia nemoris]
MAATLELAERSPSDDSLPTTPVHEGRPAPASAARRRARRAASLVVCLGMWQLAVHWRLTLGIVTFANVPAPSDVVPALWALLHSPKLPMHLFASLLRVLIGFCAAAVVGVGLGLAIGRYRMLEDTLLPPLEILRPIPAVAWIPLAILMFPSSELSMMFITFIGALFPILLNTVHGVEAVDPRLVATARSLGTRGLSLYTEIILPGAAPAIFTGLSIGMGTAWFCLVTAEMIAGQYGIGYFTWESYTLQNYADIVVGMMLIGALGMGSSMLIKRLGTALTPWYRLRETHR